MLIDVNNDLKTKVARGTLLPWFTVLTVLLPLTGSSDLLLAHGESRNHGWPSGLIQTLLKLKQKHTPNNSNC